MGTDYDVIVIGGGHNGLVCAGYLAKSGRRVLVLERRNVLGGAAATEEIFPGYKVNTGAADAGQFSQEIVADLNLEANGYRWLESPVIVFSPQPDGRSLTLWRDSTQTQSEIARFSQKDAEKYPEFILQIRRFASLLNEMMRVTPPALPQVQMRELLPWARTALKLMGLGKHEMMEFLRVLPMPAADWLDEWFESPEVKGALGASSVSGSFLGPRGSGSALMMIYQAIGAGEAGFRASRFVSGGTGALSEAIAPFIRQRGGEIRTNADVRRILLEDEKAVGVELANREVIRAEAVVSNADPVHTLFDLVGARNLEIGVVREVKNIRTRASLARVNLALAKLPDFPGGGAGNANDRLSGHILIAPTLDYIEKAYDQAKYGAFSSRPMLDLTIPTINDFSIAPPGAHLLCIDAYYAPYKLKDGDWESQKDNFLRTVIETLSKYVPELPELVTQSQVITPLDLERDYGLTRGDIHHGQMGLDQLLMMRPIAGYGRYQSPIPGLYFCGAGAHPGGGVTGAPGRNAAREIIK